MYCDPNHLRTALTELIENAVKFSDDGETVLVGCPGGTDGRSRIVVRDKGCGISRDRLDHIFSAFEFGYRRSNAQDGLGLGLCIASKLVHAMGGDIGVISREGEGSMFWLEVPALEP